MNVTTEVKPFHYQVISKYIKELMERDHMYVTSVVMTLPVTVIFNSGGLDMLDQWESGTIRRCGLI